MIQPVSAFSLLNYAGKTYEEPCVSLAGLVLSEEKFMGLKASLLSMAGAKLRKADFSHSTIRILILLGADLGEGDLAATGFSQATIGTVIRTTEELRQALETAALSPSEAAWLKSDLEKIATKLKRNVAALRSLLIAEAPDKLQDQSLATRYETVLASISLLTH